MRRKYLRGGLSALTVSANSKDESLNIKSGDLYYRLEDEDEDGTTDYAAIYGCEETVKSVTVPAELGGYPVKEISASAFAECQLESVTLPDSLETIGYTAFYCCPNLKSIEIPDSVTDIYHAAFVGCTSLETVKLGKNTKSVSYYGSDFGGRQAFMNCPSLKEIIVPKENKNFVFENGALYTADKEVLVSYAIAGGGPVCNIPSGVKRIQGAAFYGLKIKKVNIPDTVTFVDEVAFCYCTELKRLVFPKSVERASECALSDMSNLDVIAIYNPQYQMGNAGLCNYQESNGKEVFKGTIYGYKDSTAEEFANSHGYKFDLIENLPPEEDEDEEVRGDVSGNGETDLQDVILISKYLLKKVTFTPEQEKAADFNGDGIVDLQDAIAIAKYILKHKK